MPKEVFDILSSSLCYQPHERVNIVEMIEKLKSIEHLMASKDELREKLRLLVMKGEMESMSLDYGKE